MNDFEAALLSQIKRLKLPSPVAEYEFHPTRKWKFDFCYPEFFLAFEVEGGIWRVGGGAHSGGKAILRDIEKYNAAALLGWRVFRIPTSHILLKGGRESYEGVELIQQVLSGPFPGPGPATSSASRTRK